MADSDNTTALPFVIQGGRRKSCAVDDVTRSNDATRAERLLTPVDPCVVLLQEWEQAHHMAVVLCRLQQRLEIRIRNALRTASAHGEADATSAAEAVAPVDRQTRWDEFDQEVGYSRARAAEAQAVEAEEEILDAVAATPAQSLAGLVAKLKIIVGGGDSMGDTSAFPWPQIQSVLVDLNELGDVEVLPRSKDGRPYSGSGCGLDGSANRVRPSISDGNFAVESHPRRS
ncbi:hypothetical protein ACHMW7_24100 [Aminobacter sp. UC22_36]|uniref:hypothetical protein n=1 Tax=Aminobacter sp. UC22_36 TaxID=3374549 RepID=UPI003757578F